MKPLINASALVSAFLLLMSGLADAQHTDPRIGGSPLSEFARKLADPDPSVRLKTVTALAEAGTEAAPALPLLLEAAEDDWERVQEAALVAVASIGSAGAKEIEARLTSADRRKLTRGALKVAGQRAIPLLAILTKSDSWRVRAIALSHLGELRSAAIDARGAVEVCIEDEAATVRLEAVVALSRIAGEGAIDALARATDDTHQAVRTRAIEGIANLEDGGVKRTEALVRVLGSPDWMDRLLAVHGLRKAGPIKVLLDSLTDDTARVRLAAAMALSERGEKSEAVANVLHADHTWHNHLKGGFGGRGGHRNLVAYGGPKLPAPPTDTEVAKALVGLAPHSVSGLVEGLSSESEITRWNSIWLISRLGGKYAHHLVPMLESESEVERRTAAILLASYEAYREVVAPILVAAFVKVCAQAVEMEHFYDDWSVVPDRVAAATKLLGKAAIPHLQTHLELLPDYRKPKVITMIEELSE